MDKIYFVRETDNKEVTLNWNKPTDGLYRRFIHDLHSLLKKYEFAFEEEVEASKIPCDCIEYEDVYDVFDGSYLYTKTICKGTKEKDECSCEGNKLKCSFYKYNTETGRLE